LRGQVDKYTWVDIGSSFLTSDLVAAFLYAQLEKAHEIVEVRIKIMEAYDRMLGPLQEEGVLTLPRKDGDSTRNGHMYYILTRSLDERTRLISYLALYGILAVFHYVPLHSSPAGRKYGRTDGLMTVTDDLSSRLLRLPVYYGMTDTEIKAVVDVITRFYHKMP